MSVFLSFHFIFFQLCGVGVRLLGSKLESSCSGSQPAVPLSEKSEEAKLLISHRCGLFDNPDLTLSICEGHVTKLTTNFHRDFVTKRVCFWNDTSRHGTTVTASRVPTNQWMREVTLEECKQLMKNNEKVLIPLGGLVCVYCNPLLKAAALPPPEAMDSQSLTDSSQDLFISQGHSQGSDSSYHPDSQEFKDERRLKLNEFNRMNNSNVDCRYVTEKPLNQQVKSERSHTMNAIGASFNSVLNTISRAPGDRGCLWKAAKHSRIVERLILTVPALTDVFLEEIIKSWNGAGNNRERIQILSVVVVIYTFNYLDHFNRNPSKKPKHSEDSDEDFENEDFQKRLTISWSPKLTEYLYDQAKNHFYRNERALVPVITEPRFAHKIKPEVLNAIFDFFSSKDVIQVRSIKYIYFEWSPSDPSHVCSSVARTNVGRNEFVNQWIWKNRDKSVSKDPYHFVHSLS